MLKTYIHMRFDYIMCLLVQILKTKSILAVRA